MSLKNQHAELRAVVSFEGAYALVGSATVKGADIYCSHSQNAWGGGPRYEGIRVSYHGSGASRLHLMGAATQADVLPNITPAALEGAMKLSGGAPTLEDWDYIYRLKADSARRRTLSVTTDQLRRGLGVEYWALEPGSEVALDVALHDPSPGPQLESVAYVIADWTLPHLAIIIKTVSEADWLKLAAPLQPRPEAPDKRTPRIWAVASVGSPGVYRSSGLFIPKLPKSPHAP